MGGVSLRKRHRHSPGGLAASTQGESGIMETVRPGPHLAGVLCNSLEVSSSARPGARAPRPAARPDPARPGRGAGDPERPCVPARGSTRPLARPTHPSSLPPPRLGAPGRGEHRHEVRTRLPASPRPAAHTYLRGRQAPGSLGGQRALSPRRPPGRR